MLEVRRDPRRVAPWQDAADGGQVDWHDVFAGYEATVDWPGCAFFDQLMDSFQDAMVLLTVRDPDAWYDSMAKTLHAVTQAAASGALSGGSLDPPSPEFTRMTDTVIWDRTFGGRFSNRAYAIEIFGRHIEYVRATVPPERLLVHEIAEGWAPLTWFLGVPPPSTPFPRLNDTNAFREMVGLPVVPAASLSTSRPGRWREE